MAFRYCHFIGIRRIRSATTGDKGTTFGNGIKGCPSCHIWSSVYDEEKLICIATCHQMNSFTWWQILHVKQSIIVLIALLAAGSANLEQLPHQTQKKKKEQLPQKNDHQSLARVLWLVLIDLSLSRTKMVTKIACTASQTLQAISSQIFLQFACWTIIVTNWIGDRVWEIACLLFTLQWTLQVSSFQIFLESTNCTIIVPSKLVT